MAHNYYVNHAQIRYVYYKALALGRYAPSGLVYGMIYVLRTQTHTSYAFECCGILSGTNPLPTLSPIFSISTEVVSLYICTAMELCHNYAKTRHYFFCSTGTKCLSIVCLNRNFHAGH